MAGGEGRGGKGRVAGGVWHGARGGGRGAGGGGGGWGWWTRSRRAERMTAVAGMLAECCVWACQ